MNQVSVERNDLLEILLVADSRDEARPLSDAFEEPAVAATPHTVLTTDAALDALRRDEDASVPFPDIVLIYLPRSDAVELLEAIESERRFAPVPVLVVVDGGTDATCGLYYERGANACLEAAGEFDALVSATESFWCNQAQLPPK
ncbi:response regulator [Haloterrigena sp. SYSU A121-1]|uniref:Response regulator n=1 Tax=Haloterrigena gelatinilytica TaxID=2741724 RepID=A0A8J8GQ32_9EURY|nr:response regulator [Haloterrigena gelatinilytica]NUB93931.1 response regulator [Haloterrigena gelatinilytica]